MKLEVRTVWIGGVVCLLVGMLPGSSLAWWASGKRRAAFQVIEGYTTAVSRDGKCLGLASKPGGTVKGYQFEDAWWREEGGLWHTHGPTCLEPLREGQQVQLGVVHLRRPSSPCREAVVWLECLE